MKDERTYYVYILTNAWNTALYVGVTNDIARRLTEHRMTTDSFVAKYRLHKLVHVETFDDAYSAITREKQLKGGSRRAKDRLIRKFNPEWKDLSDIL